MKKTQEGFTLIELMVVVAIIGMLAMIAYPSYQTYVMRGKLTEATTNLSSLAVSAEQFYQDHQSYAGMGCTFPNAKYFTYTCPGGTSTYTLSAIGIASQGTGGFTYTIDQAGTKTTIAPADWGNGTISCWVTKPGGEC